MTELKKILIYGGGRWARQVVQELSFISKGQIELHIITPKNYSNVKKWLIENNYNNFASAYENISNYKYFSAIVVNSAADHFISARTAVENQIPTLVEKPVTLNYKHSNTLKNIAENNKTLLCAANVFLFSKRIKAFADYINSISSEYEIDITWEDTLSEIRYGELKRQDLSIPAHVDYLPHILSILKLFNLNNSITIINSKILDKMNTAKINLLANGIPCNINLRREGDYRKREVKIKMNNNFFLLDFRNDDYKIFKNNILVKNLKITNKDKPLRNMLDTFLQCARNKTKNDKLNIQFGIYINKVIDEVTNF